MTVYDVFNGDADGICALLQMRLVEPQKSVLVTGVKRDIQLLARVDAEMGDRVNVLDLSMAKNRDDLLRLLERGVRLFYVDHHMPGEIPEHPGLQAIIDTGSDTCTSLLIDSYLEGRFRPWAIVAAFGDNLVERARSIGQAAGLSTGVLERLNILGTCINYNGYGETVADLHVAPASLFTALLDYPDPLAFMADPQSAYPLLHQGYHDDLAKAGGIKPHLVTGTVAVYLLPDQAWSRRVSGVFGNRLANDYPERAHAVVTHHSRGGYQVSVRAPLADKRGADLLCSQFPSGGGRQGAAGINALPESQLDAFISAFRAMYGRE